MNPAKHNNSLHSHMETGFLTLKLELSIAAIALGKKLDKYGQPSNTID